MTDPRAQETRLIHSLMGLIGACRALGTDAARDTITAHCDLGDGGDDPWEVRQCPDPLDMYLIDQIGHAIQRAGEIAEDYATRCITIEDAGRGQRAHFSWADGGEPLSDAYAAAVHNAVWLAVGREPIRLTLPVEPSAPRQWSVAEHSGECFREDDDYDGWILQIELRDEAEAETLARHMQAVWPVEDGE